MRTREHPQAATDPCRSIQRDTAQNLGRGHASEAEGQGNKASFGRFSAVQLPESARQRDRIPKCAGSRLRESIVKSELAGGQPTIQLLLGEAKPVPRGRESGR